MFHLHNNLKSKILFGIVTLGILLAPVSPIFQNKKGDLAVGVEVNKVKAEESLPATDILKNSTVEWESSTDTTAKIIVDLKSTYAGQTEEWKEWSSIMFYKYQDTLPSLGIESWTWVNDNGVILVIKDENDKYVSHVDLSKDVYDGSIRGTHPIPGLLNDLDYLYGASEMIRTKTITGLTSGKTYKAQLYFLPDTVFNPNITNTVKIIPGSAEKYYNFGNTKIFTTSESGETTQGTSSAIEDTTVNSTNTDTFNFNCSLSFGLLDSGTFTGCIAEVSYLIFEVSAFIARGAGGFLDIFVYYSTNSSSYTNTFITKAFGAVRDVANIFFIIALLYVAIKTILDLNVSNNKKIIGSIILVALFINFSLFATQIIIDGSNILAKVFYNQISSVDENDDLVPAGAIGQKSISVGLVDKFNPQKILSSGVGANAQAYYKSNPGKFIFITLLAVFIVLYAAYIFISVALLFVSRVVTLWFSMIFAPIAFASFTIPGLNIPGLGFKDWWDNLSKNAFLAPIFIFFLFIIVMFTDFLKEIVSYNTTSPDTMQQLMTVIIPFAILSILLMKAKDVAVKLSGEMGKAITKAGAVVGGLAVGAVTGGAAFAARGTFGALGGEMANSSMLANLETKGFGNKKWLQKSGINKVGRMMGTGLRNTGKAASTGSWDIRGVKIGGKGLADTGLRVGKAKEGGYEKEKAVKSEKRQKRAEELKNTLKKGKLGEEVRKTEEDLQELLDAHQKELAELDKKITDQEKVLTETNRKYGGGTKESKEAGVLLANLRAEKRALREGAEYKGDEIVETVAKTKKVQKFKTVTKPGDYGRIKTVQEPDGFEDVPDGVEYVIKQTKNNAHKKYIGDNYKAGNDYIDENGESWKRSIANMEKIELINKKHTLEAGQRQIANDYAKKITKKKPSNLYGLINAAEKDAAHKIKMGVKLDSDGKKAH